ncbi:MAG: hypothetical protein ACE5ES_00115 [Candidatus Nanoarchaeia archaeon]
MSYDKCFFCGYRSKYRIPDDIQACKYCYSEYYKSVEENEKIEVLSMEYEELLERYVTLRDELKIISNQLKKLQKERFETFRENGEIPQVVVHDNGIKEEYIPPREYRALKRGVTLDKIAYEHPEYFETRKGYEQIRLSRSE